MNRIMTLLIIMAMLLVTGCSQDMKTPENITEEKTETQPVSMIYGYYRFCSAYGCHWLESKQISDTSEFDFGHNVTDTSEGYMYVLAVRNTSSSAIDIPKEAVWIDGDDKECFVMDHTGKNIRVFPDSDCEMMRISFCPDSIGEKKAVLHIKANEDQQEIRIPLRGIGVSSHEDFDGMDFICYGNPVAIDTYSSCHFIAPGDDEGFFTIHSAYRPGIIISEWDRDGNKTESHEFGTIIGYPDYAYRIGDVIRIYESENSCFDFDINTGTLSERKPCPTEEYLANIHKSPSSPHSIDLKYGDYAVRLSANGNADFSKDGKIWATVAGLFSPATGYDACISGDCLYWLTDCQIGRVKLKKTIEDLEKTFRD